jgi:HSP20 family molecular chaperone IbpA
MSKETDKIIASGVIRHHYDEKSKKWYFSIVDIISIVADTKDARNYWKVLKSRLNKGNPELVTNCNQLKMPSSDGKMYLTDVADSDTILEIIKTISPSSFHKFRSWFNNIESENTIKTILIDSYDEAELTIDAYQDDKEIIVQSLIAGVSPENIIISVDCKNIMIRGKRLIGENTQKDNYNISELYWGAFSRSISLPEEVDIDEVEATLEHGLLRIKLPKVNKLRRKNIKIKSLN